MRTLLIALLLPACAAAQSTATTTLSVTVASAATISLGTSATALTASTTWGDYTGTTTGTVRMRTSKTGGSGSVTVEITSAFASGGPPVRRPDVHLLGGRGLRGDGLLRLGHRERLERDGRAVDGRGRAHRRTPATPSPSTGA